MAGNNFPELSLWMANWLIMIGLNPLACYRPWPGFRHPGRNDGVLAKMRIAAWPSQSFYAGFTLNAPRRVAEFFAKRIDEMVDMGIAQFRRDQLQRLLCMLQ